MLSRIKIMPDPFTGELSVMTKVGIPNISRYDDWAWTSDLRYLKKVSCYRPIVYNMRLV